MKAKGTVPLDMPLVTSGSAHPELTLSSPHSIVLCSLFFRLFLFFKFLRERELGGEGQREEERENLKQAPRPVRILMQSPRQWGLMSAP